ncbi:hypothetical protein EHS13_30115 [Paenibacillus psychroresistens]|uniref:Uncharacterized protein n=1 Tax=Paenibacillus psychroresistens TaxID=1778678 RepID=A0A6B8RTQ1_9BACL|nr:hypothetical protein [Paenibacillus psychroresistens]QGQ98833.1 hypothetical protein EHS13_30115 [Paenibacillus psychroresistens]
MGGKTNIFDVRQLETIYLESRRFGQKAEASMQRIQLELSTLNDPSFQNELSAEQAISAREAISNMNEVMGVLKETLMSTNIFIEGKLAGAAQLARDKQEVSSTADKFSGFIKHMNLKK